MFRLLGKKSQKALPLGRWKTDKTIKTSMRLADLANYDSCGTCGLPDYPEKVDNSGKYVAVADDVVYVGYTPYSFDLTFNKIIH